MLEFITNTTLPIEPLFRPLICILQIKNPCKSSIYMGFNLFVVTATGFKPVTPTSVVWYSIQLSYAAITFL